jgi:pSer/pThr/pTyr-binding forkhead associated (FHA) protein
MQLAAPDLTTQSIQTGQVKKSISQGLERAKVPPKITTDSWGSLHLMDSGQILPLANRTEFTLGRVSEGQPVMPDVDLTPYQAYANGVSRLHAVLKRNGPRVVVKDLGSANGTYVNGKRLTPETERLLNHGDIVALGKLKFQVLIK